MQLIKKIVSQPDLRTLISKIRHHFLHYLRFPNRMMSVPRISMEAELATLIRPLKPGLVLDIGAEDAPYRSLVPAVQYVTVDITPGYGANVVSDIANLGCASSVFDTVIATEVLEHCRDPKLAVSELRRVLKHGGVCIITTRFIHPYHPTPQDYYRFTWDSLTDIFCQFSEVRIVHHGNTIQSIWALLGTGRLRIVFNLFNPIIARIKTKKTVNPCGFLVYAVK
jgi:SAM-dependent methyltransferase